MTIVQLEGNDIQKFLDMARDRFNLKIKVIENMKLPTITDNTPKRKKIDEALKNLKIVDAQAGDELNDALTLLGKDLDASDYKTARDTYLTQKYGL